MPYSRNNGVAVYYEVAGEGFPFVMVHANPFDHNLWLFQVSHFSTYFKIVSVDLRGYGRSDKTTEPFTFSDMAEDVFGVMRAEGIDQAILAGISVGASIAVVMALEHPELFKALIPVGGGGSGSPIFAERIRGYTEEGVEAYHIKHLEELVSPEFFSSKLGRYLIETFRERGPRLSSQAIARIFEAHTELDVTDRLGSIALPTLVVNGEFDMAIRGSHVVAENVPGAVHKIIPGAGHACCMENPAEFDAAVIEFLESHGLMPSIAN